MDLLDGGIIFGTGFAPFRGGPLHYSVEEGIDSIRESMSGYASTYGSRFDPVKGWEKVGA